MIQELPAINLIRTKVVESMVIEKVEVSVKGNDLNECLQKAKELWELK